MKITNQKLNWNLPGTNELNHGKCNVEVTEHHSDIICLVVGPEYPDRTMNDVTHLGIVVNFDILCQSLDDLNITPRDEHMVATELWEGLVLVPVNGREIIQIGPAGVLQVTDVELQQLEFLLQEKNSWIFTDSADSSFRWAGVWKEITTTSHS